VPSPRLVWSRAGLVGEFHEARLQAIGSGPRRSCKAIVPPPSSRFLDPAPATPLNGAMFGPPSISKFIILALVVALVWGLSSLVGRLQQAKRAEERKRMHQQRPRAKVAKVEDMVLCRNCGAYYAAGLHHDCTRR
jgi:hypothetical protein